MQLGIDFGTTRTVVAMADRGNYPVVDFADQHGDAQSAIPSMVASKDGELRFGFDAAAVASDPEWAILPSFKRLFATGAGTSHAVRIGETTIAFGELLERFFSHVRAAVKKRVGVRSPKATAREKSEMRAAVAVPANALGAQRLVTLDAFRRAGFDAFAMLNEPSAAGFEYTHRHRSTISSRRDLVVVYDLGGGTFDASAVRMTGTTHEVLATAGLPRLGGDDFDEVLAKTALLQVDLDLAELPSRSRRMLLSQCRDAKEALHPSSRKIVVDLDAALGKLAPKSEVVVQTTDYYDACLPLVERTIAAMEPLLTEELAGIYVVGGASELPVVSRVLRERFGRRVHRSPYPSAAVAIGLAIAADTDAELTLVDRYSRTFGVFREAEAGREVTFDPIFAPDTALPARSEGPLTRTRAYRAAHNVGHYRFFECSALDSAGKPRGDMTLFGDVHFPFDASVSDAAKTPVERRANDGPRIEESYSLDERGIVEVVIRNLDQGYERSFKLGA